MKKIYHKAYSQVGHLAKLNTDNATKAKIDEISRRNPFLDRKFLENHKQRIDNLKMTQVILRPYSDLHYLYTRSFYLTTYPLSVL
jgi:hypothetical protein